MADQKIEDPTNESAHSEIGASSYHRWSKRHGGCPGSVKLCRGLKSKESPYAAAGTLAHDIGAKLLEHYFFGLGKKNCWPKDYPAEEYKAVKFYFDKVKEIFLGASADAKEGHVLIEHKFDLTSVHPGLFGTADAVIYDPKKKKLHVIDYKHGAGILVEVEDNLQLQYYGLGAMLSTNFPCETVELHIIQPRCGNEKERSWEFQALDILDFASDLRFDAEYALDESKEAELNPGEHCRFCPAAASRCDAVKNKAVAIAQKEFSEIKDVKKEVREYESERLKKALDLLPAIEGWVKQVRECAYEEALHGRAPAGYKLVQKRAQRKWRDEKEVMDTVEMLGMEEGLIEVKKTLKSVAQMETEIGKKKFKELAFSNFVVQESSGTALVHDSDKRPAVNTDPANDFNQIQGG